MAGKVFRIGKFELRHFDAGFLFVCFVSFYLQLFWLPSYPIYFEADHVNLLNDVKRMVDGEVIYRDFFEFTFPAVQAVYYVFMKVFGPEYWIVSLMTIVHGLASVALALSISRRIIADNIYAYLPPAIYAFLGFRWLGMDGEHRMFSPVFALLAVWFLLEKRTTGRIVAAGICCALSSMFTQQRGVLAMAAIGIFFLIEMGLVHKDWPRFLKASVTLGITFFVSLSLLLLPFVLAAGAGPFFDSTFVFIASYVQDPTENSFQTYWLTFTKLSAQGYLITAIALLYHILVPAIYVVLFIVLWIKRKDRSESQHLDILLVGLLGTMLALGTAAPNTPRLFQIAAPALIVLAWLVYNLNIHNFVIKTFVFSIMIFGVILGIRTQRVWDFIVLPTPSGELAFTGPVYLERYKWLSENADPADIVYETYNSHVNFPLHLRNPSFISILLNSGYNPREQVARAITDLKSTEARYILWDGAWTREMDSLGPEEKLKPFYLYMIENYQLRQKFTPYDGREREVWERVKTGSNR